MKMLKPDPIGTAPIKQPKKHGKLTSFIKKHWKLGVVVLVVVIAAVVAIVISLNNKSGDFDTISKRYNDAKPVYYAALTGKKVGSEAEQNQAVTAIMIENSPDARPQSGLKDSGVVFEAIAEGGITRFLVLYQTEKPQLIGPVRSVRLYYVDWLTPFQASVAHVGGSATALQLVRNGSYRDIDQFFNADYYWRATDRYAPHNVYTSFEKLDALNQAKGYTKSEFTSWPRQSGKAAEQPTATNINVTISGPLYNSQYTYDAASNKYLRSHEYGGTHTDREQGQITPDTVIVVKVQQSTVFEDGNRESIETSGSGTAYIFQNGTVTECTWSKANRESQIEFKDADGKAIKLNRGQTWITAVPNSGGGVSWQ
ncbi:MAG: DUF3048 domain-containing protein [Candidatus Nomurabacteria bacterium]|jgi:hypothetical protein|nr:DUF3048 domain-containing protein [Candidatus Nomurabacteria bacterium]